MRLRAIVPLLVFVGGVVASVPAHAAVPPVAPPPVALLPVAAERVGLEAMPQMARTDELLRRAVAARTDVRVLSKAQTAENLASVREMGIACAVDDVRCLGKVAVLVDVDRLLVPLLRIDGASTDVRVLVVDRAGRSADAHVTTTAPATEAELRALVAAALAAPLQDLPAEGASTAPPTLATPAPPPATPAATAANEGPRPLFLGGVVTTSVGVVVGVGGAAGALAVDGLLAEPEDYGVRAPKILLGQALFGAAVVGGIAAIVGGSLILADVVGD